MLSVAEQMALDAKATLNPEEMGGVIVIDGLDVDGAWEPLNTSPGDLDGYYSVQRRYFITSPDFVLPVTGQELNIDGDLWLTDRADGMAGMFEIDVTRNMS